MRQRQARSSYTRWVLLLIMAVVAALVPGGTAWGAAGGPALTVMTRNLYLGTGLDNTVTATTPDALAEGVVRRDGRARFRMTDDRRTVQASPSGPGRIGTIPEGLRSPGACPGRNLAATRIDGRRQKTPTARPWGSSRCPRGDTLHTHTAERWPVRGC
jgi:hypothetical protein